MGFSVAFDLRFAMRNTVIFTLLAYSVHSSDNLFEFDGINYMQTAIKELKLDVTLVMPPRGVDPAKVETFLTGFAQGVVAGRSDSLQKCQVVSVDIVSIVLQALSAFQQAWDGKNVTAFFEGLRAFTEIEEHIKPASEACQDLKDDSNKCWQAMRNISSFKCLVYTLKKNARTFHDDIWTEVSASALAIRDSNLSALGLSLGMIFHYLQFGGYLDHNSTMVETEVLSLADVSDPMHEGAFLEV